MKSAKLYRAELRKYESYLKESEIFYDILPHRIEIQFESLCDWSQKHSFLEVKDWFLDQRQKCSMRVSTIPLKECRGWNLDEEKGAIQHQSGEFFRVEGLRVSHTQMREVGEGGWDQPIITQVGYDGGLLGIIRKRFEGVPHYLIEAKAEPGNYERVQMSPTLQATFSNLKMAHAGRKPKFSEYFENTNSLPGCLVLYKQWLSEDGGRLHLKRNLGMLVEIPENSSLELPPGFIWMSMWQIKQFLQENAWVNPHIRGIIAHI